MTKSVEIQKVHNPENKDNLKSNLNYFTNKCGLPVVLRETGCVVWLYAESVPWYGWTEHETRLLFGYSIIL